MSGSRHVRRIGTFVLAVACLALARADRAAAQGNRRPVLDLLDRYERGDHDGVAAELASAPDPVALGSDLQRRGEAWLTATGAGSTERRRLVAAVFALELAAAHLETDWGALRFAVEWACALLRKGRPSASERVWHLGVVALAGGARDDRLLIWLPPHSSTDPMVRHRYTSFVHADHAARRFPNEIRFQVADAFANELPGFHEPKRDAPGWISQQQRERGEAAIGRWKRFVDDPAVGAEAHLRIGHIYYCLANPRAAAVHYQSALQASRDPYVRYLAHFFIARMFEASGRPQDAAAAYRQALDVLPGVQSATMALAAATFLDQKPSGAYALMKAVFDGKPRPPDPWRLYDYGDYRLWPDLIARLREAIRP